MKRFHVHLHVNDIHESVAFYSKLFAEQPTKLKSDYAKWMLEDPRINFAISTLSSVQGIDHLGIETDDIDELHSLKEDAESANLHPNDAGTTTCCYAKTAKHWLKDPQGISWQRFYTLNDTPMFSTLRTSLNYR
jgi:hypothetical protein